MTLRSFMGQPDMVNHPEHYSKLPNGVGLECIEYAQEMSFCQGNAFKYVYRMGNKDDPQQDFDKAQFYLNSAINHGDFGPISSYLIDTISVATPRGFLLWHIANGFLNISLAHLKNSDEYKDFSRLDERNDV